MQIKKHFYVRIRSWYITIIFAILAIFAVISGILFYIDGNHRVARAYEENLYLRDRRAVDKILSENDKYLKITSMYSTIIAKYGYKYHPSYSKNICGLTKEQKADVVREIYECERILGIPHFVLIPKAKMETSFAPKSSTYWDKEETKIKEGGLYNNRLVAVQQAMMFYRQLSPVAQKRLNFYFTKMEDLYDPINATRIEAVNVWGCLQIFNKDLSWAIPAVHWGLTKMMKYYSVDTLPPRKFKFNLNTIKEDVRNPFTYYFWWNEHYQQFSRFDIRINIDKAWERAYKKGCSRYEREFLDYIKFKDNAMRTLMEAKTYKKEVELEWSKKNKKVDKIIKEADQKYKELVGIIKTGRFKKIKHVFDIGKLYAKDMFSELRKPEVTKMRKLAIISYISILTILIIFSIIGFVHTIKYGIHLLLTLIRSSKR